MSGNYDDSGSMSSACHDLTDSADFAEPGIAFLIIPLWFIYFRRSAVGIVFWSAVSVSGMVSSVRHVVRSAVSVCFRLLPALPYSCQ